MVADVEQLSTEELTQMLRGHDVVIWSAGAGGADPARTRAADRDAAIRTIDAAVTAGRLKQWRSIATRYDKHPRNYPSTSGSGARFSRISWEHFTGSSPTWSCCRGVGVGRRSAPVCR